MTLDKAALEKACEAFFGENDWLSTIKLMGAKDAALADMSRAIRAYEAARPVTEAEVELGARGICKARGLDWDAQNDAMRSANGGDDEQDAFRHEARACLEAARNLKPGAPK